MELEKREYQIIQAAAAAAQAESLQQVAEARALLKMKCVRRNRDAHVAASNTRRKLGTQGTQNGASNYNDDGLDKIAHLEISARRDMFSGLPEEETVKIFRNKFKPTNLYRLKIGHGALGTFLNRTGAAENSEGWGRGDADTFARKVPEVARRTSIRLY